MDVKEGVCTTIGIIGGIIASFFGGWDVRIYALVVCMAVDYISGVTVAAVFHASRKTTSGALQSDVGWKGLARKITTLLLVGVAACLDKLLSTNYIRTATIIGFTANELISIVENAGLMGLPMPSIITKAIDVLTNKADQHDIDEGK